MITFSISKRLYSEKKLFYTTCGNKSDIVRYRTKNLTGKVSLFKIETRDRNSEPFRMWAFSNSLFQNQMHMWCCNAMQYGLKLLVSNESNRFNSFIWIISNHFLWLKLIIDIDSLRLDVHLEPSCVSKVTNCSNGVSQGI